MSTRAYYSDYWSAQGFNPTGALPEDLAGLYSELVAPSSDVLDVGCGDGRTTGPWMLEHAHTYTGVDISPPAVEAAHGIGLNAVLVDDAGAMPFADRSFDIAVAIEVFEHLFDPLAAAAEVRRVLAPGGCLVCTVPHIAHWKQRADLALRGRWDPKGDDLSLEQPWRDPHIRFYTAGNLSDLLSEAGFAAVKVAGRCGSIAANFRATARYQHTAHGKAWGRLLERYPSLGARLVAVAVS